jgi:hypothetical protein
MLYVSLTQLLLRATSRGSGEWGMPLGQQQASYYQKCLRVCWDHIKAADPTACGIQLGPSTHDQLVPRQPFVLQQPSSHPCIYMLFTRNSHLNGLGGQPLSTWDYDTRFAKYHNRCQ